MAIKFTLKEPGRSSLTVSWNPDIDVTRTRRELLSHLEDLKSIFTQEFSDEDYDGYFELRWVNEHIEALKSLENVDPQTEEGLKLAMEFRQIGLAGENFERIDEDLDSAALAKANAAIGHLMWLANNALKMEAET